jgi:hypothetical protein
MDEPVIGGLLLVAALMLSPFGAMFLVMDYRHFREIERHCIAQGYIQNQTTRITCTVEPKTKP